MSKVCVMMVTATIEAGKNYIFTFRISKTAVKVTATVKDWEVLNAKEYEPKININTADLATLQTLNGVGPSTAQKIIDYRNANGKFKSIDDLKKISGIGEKTFAKFKDQICV